MLILRLFQIFALWALTAAVWAHAWMTGAAASAYDSRVRFGVAICLGAWLAGTLLGALLARLRPERWPALDLHRHVLALLATALCVDALSHVAPQVSIRVLREEVPPFLGWLYPALSALTPLLLRRTARSVNLAGQLLLLALFATAMSGAMLFLLPSVALGLALLTLGWQLDAQHGLPARSRLALLAALTVLLICLASHLGYSRVASQGSESWLLACAALGAAIAARPRDERQWRQLLGASVLAAVAVALCGALLTTWLGRVIAWQPALNSRLVLFREHPNFLAPFFGFHALLALTLGLARWRTAPAWFAAAVLLAASAWLTDSRTGFAALAASVAVLALLPVLARVVRRVRLPVLAGGLLGGLVLLGGAWLLLGGDAARATVAARFDRFEKSLDFRLDAWKNSVAIIRQHPGLGIGPDTFLAVERFEPGSRFFNAPEAPHPHNVFLYVAQAAGLPALALFLAWIAVLFARLLRRSGTAPDSGAAAACPAAPEARVPRVLLWGLLAALAGLLMANLFDLGLALETVVPAPLVIFTGLAVSTCAGRPGDTRRWVPLLAGAVLFALFVPMVLSPLRARTAVEQAQLQAYDAGQQPAVAGLMDRARSTLEHALELDPAVPKAHELLSRWREDLPGGFGSARDVLRAQIDLAPHDGEGHRLLARLLMRNALWSDAESEFVLALGDTRGSDSTTQDRADRITCLAKLGRRDDALLALADALRLDAGVLYRIPWSEIGADNRRLAMGGGEPQQPIDLLEGLERVYQRHRSDEEAGRPVGYAFWMDCYRAFRTTHRDDRAKDVLDYMEQHVPAVDRFVIAAERGNLAFDAGQLDVALAQYDLAFQLSQNPFFRNRAAKVRQALGQDVQAAEEQALVLDAQIEILDQPVVFHDTLVAEADTALRANRPALAAATLERTLLFEDDLLERARLWERIGSLYLKAGADRDGERALREALTLLDAKPWPWRSLQEGATDSMPARIARTLCDTWRRRGLSPPQRFAEAWGLPDFFSARLGPSLFRLGFYFENAQVDQLLREADLALLADRSNLLAHWARIFALEATGRHLELGMAMRTLVDQYALEGNADGQFRAVADEMSRHLKPGARPDPSAFEPQAWFKLGLLSLLCGRYDGAVGLFDNARKNVSDDPTAEADYCGWQALAAFLASKPEVARAALAEGVRLDPENEMLRLRLSVIPAVLPPNAAPPPPPLSPDGKPVAPAPAGKAATPAPAVGAGDAAPR